MSSENPFADVKDSAEDEDSAPEVVETQSTDAQEIPSTTAPAPAESNKSGIVKPVEDIDGVVEMYENFEEIKGKLLDRDKDLTKIGSGVHVNKSGWRKIATAFNISVAATDEKMWTDENGVVHAKVVATATAPNGKSMTGMAMATSVESNFMTKLEDHPVYDMEDRERLMEDDKAFIIDGKTRVIHKPQAVNKHNLLTMAETRAKNRAISDIVGGGEVSAEEMGAEFFMDN